jgi:two-component system chemotaxis response regulator CheY
MRVTLENAGFAVTVAGDGAEALREAMSEQYDVVVLDWNMPKLDGIGVLRSLRNKPGPNSLTPIVIATAAPSQQLIDEALNAGAQAVLGKPFAGDELVNVLNGAVACGANISSAASDPGATVTVDSGLEVARVLDIEALEGPGSIFRTVDPAELMGAFTRDVEKNKALLKHAASTADLGLFRASIHSLAGYAGSLGATRLQWLLATAPRDDAELRARGLIAAAELCETIDATSRALDDWLRAFLCVAQ